MTAPRRRRRTSDALAPPVPSADLEDETVRAAWRAIAAQTHPDRPDGGDLARYTQACAALAELNSPWGRSEAYADLVEAAWADGRYDAHPGPAWPDGAWPGAEPLPPVPVEVALGPVPLAEVLHLLAEIPSRFRRGHPLRLAIRAAVTAGLCLAVLVLFSGRARRLRCRRADLVARDVRPGGYGTPRPAGPQEEPGREELEELDASGGASGSRMGTGPRPAAGP